MAKHTWKLITFTDKRTTCTGALNGKFWEKHLKSIYAFWEIAGKNSFVSLSQQDWWESSQPAKSTYNLQPDLLGSFPAASRRMSRHYCPVRVWANRVKFSNSVRGGGGGGSGCWQIPHTSYSRQQIPSDTYPGLAICQQSFSFQGNVILSNLPDSKNLPKEQIFWG